MPRGAGPYHRSLLRDITAYLCSILLITACGPLQFGYHLVCSLSSITVIANDIQSELNAPQDVITCEKKSISSSTIRPSLPQCISMNTDQFAVVSSIFTLGGLLGALIAGPCCNRYGRLLTMRLTSIFFVVGPIFESMAPSISVISIGRFISGIGAGSSVVVGPIYISEVAPPEEKGFFGALTQIMINVGILLTQVLGYFLSRDNLWRIILGVAGCIGIAQLFGLFLVPESPKWLAEHNHPQKAREILRRVRGRKEDLEDEVSTWNIDGVAEDTCMSATSPTVIQLTTFLAEEESLLGASSRSKASSESVSIFGAIMNPSYRAAIIAVVAVMFAQQLTGINSIIMYSVSLLSTLLPTNAAILTVAISALNLFITTLCAPLSDKIGRKTCILLSIAGMGTSSILLALGMSYGVQVLAAIATLLFVTSFAVGLGPVPFMLANELVGPEAVGATQSWALAASWIATFIVSQFFPILNKALGEKGRVYYVFAVTAAVLGGFIAWWVPETKGKRGADEVWGRKETRERVE